MEHLKNILEGARSVLMLYGGEDYVRPRGGFARDAALLQGDARRVSDALTRVTRQHEQPVHDRKG